MGGHDTCKRPNDEGPERKASQGRVERPARGMVTLVEGRRQKFSGPLSSLVIHATTVLDSCHSCSSFGDEHAKPTLPFLTCIFDHRQTNHSRRRHAPAALPIHRRIPAGLSRLNETDAYKTAAVVFAKEVRKAEAVGRRRGERNARLLQSRRRISAWPMQWEHRCLLIAPCIPVDGVHHLRCKGGLWRPFRR